MTEEIVLIAKKLLTAVTVSMNPAATQIQRTQAYQVCEEFKEGSPLCAQCGLFLSRKGNDAIARHFGLQLIEHCIKFRWNALSSDEKLYIKNNIMELLATGTLPILEEQFYIKDAMSRLVVEMIKREWPQQWITLLNELYTLCEMGETQKELVLLIFLRLAEDVVVLQNIPNQRRREIYVGLNQNIPEILLFFLKTMSQHFTSYKDTAWTDHAIKLQLDQYPQQKKEECMIHCRIVETLLKTLCGGYLEWIPLSHLLMENCLLLRMLCHLLGEEKLQIHAADCLSTLVSRKGKIEERKPFILLFSEEAMTAIFQAAKTAAGAGFSKEEHYLFLKRLCYVLAGLGNQLAAMLGVISQVEIPTTFKMFLETMMAFTKYPSQLLTSTTLNMWATFLQHKSISNDPNLISILPALIEILIEKMPKVGYPSRNDSPFCDYSRIDFDSDDDFSLFFNKFRVDLCDMVRNVTLSDPILTFNYGTKWLNNQLVQPIVLGEGSENGRCSIHSPSVIQWEALSLFLEYMQSKTTNTFKPKPNASEGVKLLTALVEYKTEDPLIMSSVLSCISALFNCLNTEPQHLPAVLEKIFSVVVFNQPGQTKGTRDRSIKNVRRHACSSLIKMSKFHPALIAPMFDLIYTHIKTLCEDSEEPSQLSQLEKCTLYEVLVLICNEFNNYERQLTFLTEIMEPVKSMWLAEDFQKTLGSVEDFVSNIGLNKEPVEPSSDDHIGIFRAQLTFKVNFLYGVLKRSKWPDNPGIAKNGNFILSESFDGIISYRNPLTPCISPIFQSIFYLIRAMNALWIPEVRLTFHPEFKEALDIQELERLSILGMVQYPSAIKETPPCERMRRFLSLTCDTCFHILGNAGPILGEEFYALPDLSNIIFDSVFAGLEHISDFKLKMAIRVFFKPYVQFCPPIYEDAAVIPVLSSLCPFMYKKLAEKWELFSQRYGISHGYEEEMTETQEIFEDQMNRLLTREYLEMLITILFSKIFPTSTNVMDEDTDTQRPASLNEKLNARGAKLLSSETICSTLVMTIFSALHWLDSAVSLKATYICLPILKQMVADNLFKKDEEAHFVIQSILRGLLELGEHEVNCSMLISLGIQAYELLRPKYSSLAEILKRIPGVKPETIDIFDEKLLDKNPEKRIPEKKKKEMFRKIVDPIVGKNIGQIHKRRVDILNLPPLYRKRKVKDENTTDLGVCELFK